MDYKHLSLNAACTEQFGIGWSPTYASDHLWSWKAICAGQLPQNIDLKRAVNRQCGPDYKLVHIGTHAYDWRAFAPMLQSYYVLPVMQIAFDWFYDWAAVRNAVENFNSAIASIREFYRIQTGKTFRPLPTICQYTGLTADQWYNLAQLSLYDAHRAKYGDQSIEILKAGFDGLMNQNIVYIVTQFCGPNPASKISPFGAINRGNISVVPGTVCLEQRTTNDPNDFNALYAVGHELGHAFGLPHSDTLVPRPDSYGDSIMLWGWNPRPNAILLGSEKTKLLQSPYFF